MSQTMNSKVSASWGQTVAYSKPALLAPVMKFAMSGSECALTMSSLLDWRRRGGGSSRCPGAGTTGAVYSVQCALLSVKYAV